MYRLSPYTYLIEGILGQGMYSLCYNYESSFILLRFLAIGKQDISCAPLELATVMPPAGQTCSQFLQPFINTAGGYLTNPEATSDCSYCAFRTSDQLLASTFNIFYSHRWRDAGFFVAFIFFNVRLASPSVHDSPLILNFRRFSPFIVLHTSSAFALDLL